MRDTKVTDLGISKPHRQNVRRRGKEFRQRRIFQGSSNVLGNMSQPNFIQTIQQLSERKVIGNGTVRKDS